MAIKLSDIAARGGGGGGSVSWDFHAMNRDADGMLTYTKVTSSDNDVVDLMGQPTLDANGDMIFRNMDDYTVCLLYTSPSPRDRTRSRMPSSA